MLQGTQKQIEAFAALTDKTTKEVFYGGAAGGGKSFLGCFWLITMCLAYNGTRWFIARQELKRIKQSTYITFVKVAKMMGVEFGYNDKYNFITINDSQIDLLDVRYLPSDALYERFGSIEYTGGWIEEIGETNFGAYDVLKTRIGRHMNDTYGLVSKLLGTCNPKKSWLYTDIYKPAKDGTLPKHIKFIQAFVSDNPYLTKDYIENLKNTKDKNKKERLLYGNWEYDDDPNKLIDYDDALNIFTNSQCYDDKASMYITADIARLGSDKAIIGVWQGFTIIEIVEFDKSKTTEIQNAITALKTKHKVVNSNIIADEDGVGGGVVDNLRIKGFQNNARPIADENYQNLKSQCYYKLAESIQDIYIKCDVSTQTKQQIIEELEQVKSWDSDSDGKLKIMPKEQVKANIGRSPDYSDMMMMRMYFNLSKTTKKYLVR